MDITPEILGNISKDGILAVAVIYLWNRVVSLTDTIIGSIKDVSKVLQEDTIAKLENAKSMDALKDSINRLIEKGVK